MATAVARPPHPRRQGAEWVTSAPLPVLGAPTSTVTLDGRLLEIQDVQQRGRLQKEDDGGRGPTKAQNKGAVARPPPLTRAPQDKPPMTPPRVSGVSLAPLPNLEHHISCCGGEKSPGAQAAPNKLQRRPSMSTHLPLGGKAPPPPQPIVVPACAGGAVAAAGGCGGGGAVTGAHDNKHSQLIAEGRGIARSVSWDPWVAAYLDINGTDADSVCATPPPRLNMQSLARADAHGAFGPLSPCPLSPSILTVCGQPGHDDQFAISGALDLIDMRTCQSPKLPPVY